MNRKISYPIRIPKVLSAARSGRNFCSDGHYEGIGERAPGGREEILPVDQPEDFVRDGEKRG